MSRLQDVLSEKYAEHYQRLNAIEDAKLTPEQIKPMQLMYGPFVDSLPEGSKVLDVGCGMGNLLAWLARKSNLQVFGVDSSASQVEVALRNVPDAEITCANGLAYLDQHPGEFAGVFCIDVVEHLPEDILLEFIEAIYRSLKPGGFFFCRVPNAANLTGSYSRYLDLTHQRSFTRTSLIQLLGAGEFTSCEVVPIRSPRLQGTIRLKVEWLLHRIVYLITRQGPEHVFTNNVNVVGYRE